MRKISIALAFLLALALSSLSMFGQGNLGARAQNQSWDATLTANFSDGSDDMVFGVRPDATSGFDNAYDIPEPPSPPEPPYLQVYSHYPNQTPDRLHRSCLAPENLLEWPLRIASAGEVGDVTLVWNIENIPSEYSVRLLEGGSVVADMVSSPEYTFQPSPGSHDFTIRVQKEGAVPTYSLTTKVQPSEVGSVSLDPPGGSYDGGTVVTAAAEPAAGYEFDHWSGDASGSEDQITVKMDSDKNITAHFSEAGEGEPEEGEDEDKEGGEGLPMIWLGVGIGIIAAVIVVFLLRRKSRKEQSGRRLENL